MEFYDAHLHFHWPGPFDEMKAKWLPVASAGLKGGNLLIIGHHPSELDKCLAMIPTAYHSNITQSFVNEDRGARLRMASEMGGMEVFPYFDSRFFMEPNPDLKPLRDEGYRGLKILYVPDEDPQSGIIGWKKLFGRKEREAEHIVSDMVEQAYAFGWPIIFHVNLKMHKGFVKEVMTSNPGSPFIIPHFGFSRKTVVDFMEQFEHSYTDFSSLLTFMQDHPRDYTEFIKAYQDRILFATDASMSTPDKVIDYLDFLTRHMKDEAILAKILHKNYLRIHKKDPLAINQRG